MGLPLSTLQVDDFTTNLGASTPLQEGGMSLRIPIKRTPKWLRLSVAAHVKR